MLKTQICVTLPQCVNNQIFYVFHPIRSIKFTFTFSFLLVIYLTFCRYVSCKTALPNDTIFQKQHSVMSVQNIILIYSYSMISGFSQDNHMSFISNHQNN